jgi:L-alanine-DL-glutamate epimerase-like enolase superfamily enzyme
MTGSRRIVSVEVRTLAAQADRPYLGRVQSPSGRYFRRPPWRSLYSHLYESLVVRIEDDEGMVGWGEALAPVGANIPAAVVKSLLGPQLRAMEMRSVGAIRDALADSMRERGHTGGHQADALAACEIALWDLWGRAKGASISTLWGGPRLTQVPAYVSGLPRPTIDEKLALAMEWLGRGFNRFKLAAGYGIDEDLALFDAVTAAGSDVQVAIDAHWAYDVREALVLGRALDHRRALFLEAPLVPEDLEGHRRLVAELATPVAVGEAFRTRWEALEWLRGGGVALVQPDVGRTGLREAIAIADLAEAFHRRISFHHSTGLGIVLAAGLHVAAIIPNLAFFEFQADSIGLANSILLNPISYSDGALNLPSGQGLGVDLDLDAIDDMTQERFIV